MPGFRRNPNVRQRSMPAGLRDGGLDIIFAVQSVVRQWHADENARDRQSITARRSSVPEFRGEPNLQHRALRGGLRDGGMERLYALQPFVRQRHADENARGGRSSTARRRSVPECRGEPHVQQFPLCGGLRDGRMDIIFAVQRFLRQWHADENTRGSRSSKARRG